ncbi:MAG: YraN family protein [Acidobacteria bacterium]|nr:YraN family protein [Acidobacteriota bacterium]
MNELTQLDLNSKTEKTATRILGETGLGLAAEFLVRRGMRIVCSNFTVPIGRNLRGAAVTGEIDIVALDGDVLCFVEVKTRTSADFASPVTAVDLKKQRQIIRTARIYRKIFGVEQMRYRYDAVAVVAGERPSIEHFRNYWNEAKFRRKNWDRHF